jgi:hypothetical protein
MIGRTVQEELERRGDCRYGMSGVEVRVRGYPGRFLVEHNHWNARGELVLTACPAEGPRPTPGTCDCDLDDINRQHGDSELVVHTAACRYWDTQYPSGTLHDVPAADCILASRWPIACCRPRDRKPSR